MPQFNLNVPLAHSLVLPYPELELVREEPHRIIFKGSQSDCQSFATNVKNCKGEATFKKGLKSDFWYVSVLV